MRWHIVGDDKWQVNRIAQIYRDPSVQGMTMYRSVFEDMQYSFKPTAILTNKSVSSDITEEDEVASILNIADMKKSFAQN